MTSTPKKGGSIQENTDENLGVGRTLNRPFEKFLTNKWKVRRGVGTQRLSQRDSPWFLRIKVWGGDVDDGGQLRLYIGLNSG